MARLIDDLLAEVPQLPTGDAGWMSPHEWRQMHARTCAMLAGAPRFVVDNVAEYFYAGARQDRWEVARDFPNLAPPFPTFWMEARRPSAIQSEGYGTIPSHILPSRWGALFIGDAIDDGDEGYWHVSATPYVQPRARRVTGPPGSFDLRLDRDGTLIDGPRWWLPTAAPHDIEDDYFLLLTLLLYPMLLAISFLHCRNVTIESTEPPKRLSRARAKRTGVPLQPYQTLNIHPMREILRREGQSETQGLQRALHICRGHFKTFTEDRKLFGKHAGTYWWGAQVRGTSAEDPQAKTYKIHPPDNA